MKKSTSLPFVLVLLLAFPIFSQSFAQSVMLNESFDDETFPPVGWQNIQLTGTGLWARTTAGIYPPCSPHSGAYAHREELFPDATFRLAYDRLVADHGQRAGPLEYLHLLKLAAELGESAIASLVGEFSGPGQPQKWTVAGLRRHLGLQEHPAVPELHLEPELASYDALLSEEVNHAA